MSDGNVDRFSHFVAETTYASLPHQARIAAKSILRDSVAVGIAGHVVPSAKSVLDTAMSWGSASDATALGSGIRLPVSSAAYVNSFQVHCQEYDSLHEPATVHAMAVLTGALLAMAEERNYSGEQLIQGVAVGVDIASNLGLAANAGLSFFRPATAGAMGATAALAGIDGFDADRFKSAWGLAHSQLAGTMQAHVEGSVALPLQVAAAARSAVNSIQLAERGLVGPHDVLDGPFGYFRLFEPGGSLDGIADRIGKTWRITEMSLKPFPTGRAAHGTLDALHQLARERDVNTETVVAIEAHVPPLIERLVARPIHRAMSVNYARLCLQYLGAVFLRHGAVDTRSFSDELLGSAEILQIGERIIVINDGNPDPNALRPQRIVIRFRDGTEHSFEIPHTLGSPENPLSAEAERRKFDHCMESAGLNGHKADALHTALSELESIESIGDLMQLTS